MSRRNSRFLAVLVVLAIGVGLLSACDGGKRPDGTASPSGDAPDLGGDVAMTVGEIRVSPAQYNIFYANVRDSVTEEFDANDLPPFGEEFDAAVAAQTDDTIFRTVSMAAEAHKSGMVLSGDSQGYIDRSMASIDAAAGGEGVSADMYLSEYVGAEATRADYEKCLTDMMLASQWMEEKMASFTYDQATYDEYYDQHRDELDTVTFHYEKMLVEYLKDDAEQEAAKDAVRARADAFAAKVVSEASFAEAAAEVALEADKALYESNPDITLYRDCYLAELTDGMRAWLGDPARRTGDKTVLWSESDMVYQILYFIDRQRPDYHSARVRHILVAFRNDAGETVRTPDDSQKTSARTQAQAIYDQWTAGAATEDSFAELATMYSDDTVTQSTGGLYEYITKGSVERPFEDWCYDPARKAGDTGLIETVSGFHVMYFISESKRPEWMELIHERLASDDMSAQLNILKENYPLVKNDSGMSQTLYGQIKQEQQASF